MSTQALSSNILQTKQTLQNFEQILKIKKSAMELTHLLGYLDLVLDQDWVSHVITLLS